MSAEKNLAAIASYCNTKQKIKDLDEKKNVLIKPLTQKENNLKLEVLNEMKKNNLTCVKVDEKSYLRITSTCSSRAINKDRVFQAFKALAAKDNHNKETFVDDIYREVRNVCTVQKDSVVIRACPERKRKLNLDPVVKEASPELVDHLKHRYATLQEHQNQLKEIRSEFKKQREYLDKKIESSEPYVKEMLDNSSTAKQKVKLNSNGEKQTYILQSRKMERTINKKNVGLKDFYTILSTCFEDFCKKYKFRWDDHKNLFLNYLLGCLEKYQMQTSKKVSNNIIFVTTPQENK